VEGVSTVALYPEVPLTGQQSQLLGAQASSQYKSVKLFNG